MAAPKGRGLAVSMERAVKAASAVMWAWSAFGPYARVEPGLEAALPAGRRNPAARRSAVNSTPILELSMAEDRSARQNQRATLPFSQASAFLYNQRYDRSPRYDSGFDPSPAQCACQRPDTTSATG